MERVTCRRLPLPHPCPLPLQPNRPPLLPCLHPPVAGSLEDRLREVTLDVKAMAFHPSGELLALGAEDGSVAVYEWPSMRLKLDLRWAAHRGSSSRQQQQQHAGSMLSASSSGKRHAQQHARRRCMCG